MERPPAPDGSLRQWMGDIFHELRTPISVLRAQIEAIQDGVNQADERTLGVLLTQVMAMSRLVDDLHTLARHDGGQLHYHHAPLHPLDLLDDTILAFRARLAQGGLMLERGPMPVPDPVVLGDSARLRQVFANLLENSVRYTDSGGWLRVSAFCQAQSLTICLEDSAPGVPEDCLDRLFDRFFRVEESRSRALGGSGIGLAVCRSIIDAHGGTILAQPSPLGGLAIIMQLPLSGD